MDKNNRQAGIDRREFMKVSAAAMAAGLADHICSLHEWLTYPAVQLR